MRRRLIILVAAVLAALIVAVATLPFWLGAATRAVGRSRGLTFAAYERVGYARFALRDVEFRRGNVRVTVSRAEAPTPVLWAWRHWRDAANPIVAERWLVEVTKSTTPPKPTTTPRENGWVPLRAMLNRIANQLERWLPQAETGAGLVRFPGGEISVASARWRDRELAVSGLSFRALNADATVSFARDDVLRLRARTAAGDTALAIESRGAEVSGDLVWKEQRAVLNAAFEPRGWKPREARVTAEQWVVPGETLKLGQVYSTVRGSARVEWRAERLAAEVKASSEPVEGKAAPPLTIDLRGEGDAQAFTIAALQAEVPGVMARLSEPVTVERSGKLRGDGARLALQVDLAKQPWFAASGAVTGEARVVSGEAGTRVPTVEFSVQGRDVTAKDVKLAGLDARGRLTWPRLELSSGTLVAGEGERIELRGGWDFKAREIRAATVEGQVRRQTLARWLPKQPEFEVVTISARASGPIAEMQHEGNVRTDAVKFSGVNPLALALSWRGRGIGAEHFDLEARAGGSRVVAAGAVARESAQLTALEFTQAGEPRLKLDAPATVRWKPALQVEGLRLAGPQGNLSAAAVAGETGKVELAAANISSRWFTDFLPERGPAWQVTLLALIGTWDRGPMNFSLTAGAALDLGEGRTAAVNAAARGDKGGLRIEALRATEGDATVVNATGRLPVTVSLGASPLVRIDENASVAFDATAAPHAAFWQKLATVSGVELREPEAVAAVRGTWRQPEGSVTFKAARVAIDPKKVARPLPAVEQIDVHVTGDRRGVTLDRFGFSLEGQPVRARGRLPVPDENWGALFKQPLAIAQKEADLVVDVPEAEIAVFSRFLPAVLAPKGRISAHVTFKEGALDGSVRLRDAASKPLGPLGVLQEISADIELEGRKLVLRELTARSGGQPVTLSGTVELPEAEKKPGAAPEPRFDLALKGENLPFVRQTGLLLRGDLDLKLQTQNSSVPRLSGTVRLRDSLFLADVRSFLPQGGAGPKRRPPYFSVDTPPVNAWGLAVEVVGEKFMRLRTPVFSGVASAHFRLSGTLGEPRAIGEVEIEEGAVRMPFARFEVQQGAVLLTESDPYEPTIYLRGTGRRYGYDLTLEIDGKASAPNVVFTSSPALESEQVLLMVMTGAAPRNGTGKSVTDRATSIGMFLGSSLVGSLTGGADDPERLTFTSDVSREGEDIYDLEYKLTDRWTITGERTEFEELNVGLKWLWLRGERKGERKETADANGEK